VTYLVETQAAVNLISYMKPSDGARISWCVMWRLSYRQTKPWEAGWSSRTTITPQCFLVWYNVICFADVSHEGNVNLE